MKKPTLVDLRELANGKAELVISHNGRTVLIELELPHIELLASRATEIRTAWPKAQE